MAKIISWNVNGIRAVHKKGFVPFIEKHDPDILCLQETKCHPDQVEKDLLNPAGRVGYWSAAKRKGYSGVATFVKSDAKDVRNAIGIEEFDNEGRFIITNHGDFDLYNIYFPNGGSGLERHNFKQDFLKRVLVHFNSEIKKEKELIVVGDYNVAHTADDIYDPIKLDGESGFMPEEREWFDQFLKTGFIDTFRFFYPTEKKRFTWWSYREMARIGNRGWRIDYICVTKGLEKKLKSAAILDQVEGSDHCPILLEI